MVILRRVGLLVSALLLCASFIVLAFAAGLPSMFGAPQPLKTALRESGVYEEMTPEIISKQTSSTLPLKDIGVRTALEKALPEVFYQHASEQMIDGTYNWMRGSTATPEFSIDTTAAKSNFADNIATYLQQRFDALPACTRIMAPPTSVEDALSLVCMPPGITSANIASAARKQVQNSEWFFTGDTITAATLKDKQGETFTQQFAFLPLLYRWYAPALVVLAIIIALLTLAIIFWSTEETAGLRRIAWILLCVGLTGMVFAAVGVELFHMAARLFGLPLSLSADLQDKLLDAVETLSTQARPWWLGVCGGYTLLGIALFVILKVRRPKQTLRFSSK